jgi:ribosomal protein L12E/L44/L45/RPP1/RPP2
MSDTPTVTQQYSFAVGEDGGTDGIEPSEESVETSLEAFGANVDHRERDTRIAQPEATNFGVDDRKTVTRGDGGEQHALFADTTDDQQTLTGERAASQCLFESGDDPEDGVITASDEAPRAVADGGHVEDDESEAQSNGSDDEGSEPDESDDGPEDGDDTDPTFDPDEETVTDAWEGAFISASWGYNQTNVELAQIVEVSGSGKTVLAQFVTAERVGHGRTSEQLRPTADQHGDEFRLQVRSVRGDPMFRGSYPLGNDGDMDGPTRRGSFYPWNNDPDNSIRQTTTNHGH